jgi:hypothetical protein
MALTGVLVLLMGTAFTAWASSAEDQGILTMPGPSLTAAGTPTATPSAQQCTKLDVTNPIAWYVVNAKHQAVLDQPVQSYPSGTKAIAAGFDYTCVPANTFIISAFYRGSPDGDPALVLAAYTQPSNDTGTEWATFYYDGRAPVEDGDWYVQFYRNLKEPLASGHITVGGQAQAPAQTPVAPQTPATGQVSVQGTVVDRATGNPVSGASVTLLNPGVSARDWANNVMDPANVYASGQSDANGKFVLDSPIDLNVSYVLVVVADKYIPYDTHVKAYANKGNSLDLSVKLTAAK